MHDKDTGIVRQCREAFDEENLHLVHRLDDGTSGCLILARTPESAAKFEQLFRQHAVQKYYLALTDKKPKKKQGTISGDMKNRRGGQHILLKTQENPAITQFFSFGFENAPRLFVVKPLSGKTHQIRVAMKSLGSPLLGDTLYGGNQSDRMYLHAWGLEFDYFGEAISVFAPPLSGHHFTEEPVSQWLDCASSPASLNWPKYTRKLS